MKKATQHELYLQLKSLLKENKDIVKTCRKQLKTVSKEEKELFSTLMKVAKQNIIEIRQMVSAYEITLV